MMGLFLTLSEGFVEVELMVTSTTTVDRVNIGQSASGRWIGKKSQRRKMTRRTEKSKRPDWRKGKIMTKLGKQRDKGLSSAIVWQNRLQISIS